MSWSAKAWSVKDFAGAGTVFSRTASSSRVAAVSPGAAWPLQVTTRVLRRGAVPVTEAAVIPASAGIDAAGTTTCGVTIGRAPTGRP